MAASTLITDYIGHGLLAARPASPPVGSNASAFYFATDTGLLYVWDGSAWHSTGSGGAPTLVQSGAAAGFITGLTLSAAPAQGNFLLAIFGGNLVSSPGTGWAILQGGTSFGGTLITTTLWKVAGAGESATQNPLGSGLTEGLAMFEINGGVPFGGLTEVDASGTTVTVTPTSPQATGLIVGAHLGDNSSALPTSFTGATAGATASDAGTNRAAACFSQTLSSAGAHAVAANFASSTASRMAAYVMR